MDFNVFFYAKLNTLLTVYYKHFLQLPVSLHFNKLSTTTCSQEHKDGIISLTASPFPSIFLVTSRLHVVFFLSSLQNLVYHSLSYKFHIMMNDQWSVYLLLSNTGQLCWTFAIFFKYMYTYLYYASWDVARTKPLNLMHFSRGFELKLKRQRFWLVFGTKHIADVMEVNVNWEG